MADNSPKKWFALEESFFHSVDEQLLERLRKQSDTEARADAIQRVTGGLDAAVAREIAALDISVESLAALRLVPMIAVAWADDRIDDNERYQVLKAAEKAQIFEGDASYELLKNWLVSRPPLSLLDTWVDYAKTLSQSLDGEARASLRTAVVGQARAVAEATGGLLGFGSVSPSEKEVIARIEAALA